jgi:hypothetical protein
MRVILKKEVGNQDVLAGSAEGGALLSRLLRTVTEPSVPEALFLDFAGIAVATTSFLRDGPLAYRQLVRSRGSSLYPVIANANDKIIEELRLFLGSQNDAMFCCALSKAGSVSRVRMIGTLDQKQFVTLELVRRLKEVDAGALLEGGYDPSVKATAWNNRLAALVEKGLVIESARGRAKYFRLSVGA